MAVEGEEAVLARLSHCSSSAALRDSGELTNRSVISDFRRSAEICNVTVHAAANRVE